MQTAQLKLGGCVFNLKAQSSTENRTKLTGLGYQISLRWCCWYRTLTIEYHCCCHFIRIVVPFPGVDWMLILAPIKSALSCIPARP